MSNGIYQRYTDNAVWNAVITATVAPSTSYALTSLQAAQPFVRVLWGVKTVTITFTFGSAVTADLFALPVSNLQGSVLTLTNGAGLSQAITLPALPVNRIPLTAIASFASSSSTVWNLVISGNADNVALGGCVWLGQARTLARNFRYSYKERERMFGAARSNDFGADYLMTNQTMKRWIDVQCIPRDAEIAELKAWHQGSRWQPGLFWPNPSVNDAYVGVWETDFAIERAHPRQNPIAMTFGELSKGKPV